MFRSLLKNRTQLLLFIDNNKQSNPITHLRFLSKTLIQKPNQNQNQSSASSFTVSYLINSCGLSPQSALSAAKRIQLKNTEGSDSFLNFFKSHGFTDAQITTLISKCPILLRLNLGKNIKPKLEYFQSLGYSGADVAALISSVPHVLTGSLENRLKPNFELLSSIIGNNQLISSAIRQTSRILQGSLETNFLPNVRTLQSCGVPGASIAKLTGYHPRVILQPTERFNVTVELIREMGFNPLSTMFVHGVAAVSRFNPSTWSKKIALFKSLGWSEREVFSAFAKHPFCMLASEHKIRKAMDFYVKKQQWGPSFLSARPVLLSLSLEKRVMPRCSARSVLESKGLLTRGSSVHFLMMSEKDFLDKYVIKYKNQVPEVLEAYKVKMELA